MCDTWPRFSAHGVAVAVSVALGLAVCVGEAEAPGVEVHAGGLVGMRGVGWGVAVAVGAAAAWATPRDSIVGGAAPEGEAHAPRLAQSQNKSATDRLPTAPQPNRPVT